MRRWRTRSGTPSYAACPEAKARFDPEVTEADRPAAADARRFDVKLAQVSYDGTVHVEGDLDLADAFDLNAVVAAGASSCRRWGP